tara:strand:+ start:2374 stop:2619 length:246 start_codon:yes stop_codon:yes gene_type:complete
MSELFALLVGICSINYCSFSIEHRVTGDWLAVNVYDKRSEVIDKVQFDISALEFDIIIREQLKLKPNLPSCLGKTMVTSND